MSILKIYKTFYAKIIPDMIDEYRTCKLINYFHVLKIQPTDMIHL